MPYKVSRIRKKEKIKVLFVLTGLGSWKSELLCKEMIKHPRFNVSFFVTTASDEDSVEEINKYLKTKNYSNVITARDQDEFSIKKEIKPDIIFYQKPYEWQTPWKFSFRRNLNALFCYINYGFHGVDKYVLRNTSLLNLVWQNYFENIEAWRGSSAVMDNNCVNGYITGMPLMDEMMIPRGHLADPWYEQGNRKRIIWAPHHTISIDSWLNYSTFLDHCDFMLELASRYQSKVYFAFKPHPVLRKVLYNLWGEQRTEAYYKKWANLENAQIEEGKYLGLFKWSDAMIHDCGSFTVEYHYTENPVLYLVKDDKITDGFNGFQQRAFDLHYKAKSKEEIENFILNVINGVDPMKEDRILFKEECLIPPLGNTASQNIIDCILYKGKDKQFKASK